MPSITDIIVLFIIVFFIYRGWQKGFLRTILGPLSLVLCTFGAYVYYYKTKNIPFSLLIAFIGPIGLTIFVGLSLTIWRRFFNKEGKISHLSRILGSFLNLLWSGSILVGVLTLLLFIPQKMPFFRTTQKDFHKSITYKYLNNFFQKRIPSLANIEQRINVLSLDPQQQPKEVSDKLNELRQDERIQSILSDPVIANQIEKRDISQLISNPKILAIAQDEDLMMKFLDIYKSLPQENKATGVTEPKVYEVK
jgi:uncharacterized membrane protein required for colicin V production